ncbi:hypothetical protein [Glycomyces tenuis]|uniref:hypothetical protein n=1 Tax=Glycomyces tenuis TaxID=58116 RepID=UPI0012DCB5B2|nr:hypothetical protein [Glycomyces tenuis]
MSPTRLKPDQHRPEADHPPRRNPASWSPPRLQPNPVLTRGQQFALYFGSRVTDQTER